MSTNEGILNPAVADELTRVCRTAVGDELRSIAYFSPEAHEQLYLRSDLESTADLMGFAEIERTGFRAQTAYQDTQLGDYQRQFVCSKTVDYPG